MTDKTPYKITTQTGSFPYFHLYGSEQLAAFLAGFSMAAGHSQEEGLNLAIAAYRELVGDDAEYSVFEYGAFEKTGRVTIERMES